MNVVKKINHNVVLINDDGVEKIAMGKGIGFGAIINEPFDPSLADKFFTLDSSEKTKLFSEMASKIPLEFIDFAEEMIHLISSRIKIPLDSNIYIAMTDHIYFAIQRKKEDSKVSAIMLPEMKLLYPDEYEAATEVVEQMNKRYGTELGANEIGFITMHIINAELGETNSMNSLKILEMSTEILQFLESQKKNTWDKESLNYYRLMIHVKFLVKRLIYQEAAITENFSFLSDSFRDSDSYLTALAVKEIIEKKYQLKVQENDVIYLAIHLARIK